MGFLVRDLGCIAFSVHPRVRVTLQPLWLDRLRWRGHYAVFHTHERVHCPSSQIDASEVDEKQRYAYKINE